MPLTVQRILLYFGTLVIYFNLNAQRTINTVQTSTLLVVGKNMIQADNLTYADFLGDGNIMQHTASFDIQLSDDAAARSILQLLQTPQVQSLNPKERTGRLMSFIKVSQLGETIEERQCLNTTVEDISFTTLDAASRVPVKATIRLKSANVNLVKGGTRVTTFPPGKNVVQSSNFSISLGNLPVSRVSRISGLHITPGNPALTNFTIELLASDGAAWNQWFLTSAGGIKKEQGTISLLSSDLKNVSYYISLQDVEIISYSVSQGTQPGMNRAVIGLRMKGMAIK